MTRAPLAACFATFLLGLGQGCSDMSLAEADGAPTGAYDTGSEVDGGGEPWTLRIDVDPGAGSGFEPQSFSPEEDADWGNLDLALSPTVKYAGIVLGFRANPYSNAADGDPEEPPPPSVTVPGSDDVPVYAQVRAVLPETITESVTTTDDLGRFSLSLPAAEDYQISVVPLDPADLPMLVLTGQQLGTSTTVPHYLDYGDAVYGTVHWTGAAVLPDSARVRLVDFETGVEGPSSPIGADGGFVLRALPGNYTLLVEADETSWLPTVETDITVTEDERLEVGVDLGAFTVVTVHGTVRDTDGRAVNDAKIRLTSKSLVGSYGSSQIVLETDRRGDFEARIVTGNWGVEVIPPFESEGALSPTGLTFEAQDDVDLGSLTLPERVELEGMVIGADGAPKGSVVVTAVEQGFDGYMYSGVTDDDGFYSILVPDVPMSLSLTPPDASAAITHQGLTPPIVQAGGVFQLVEGRALAGQVTAEGDPVRFAYVELVNGDGDLYGRTWTDDAGQFSVRVQDVSGDR